MQPEIIAICVRGIVIILTTLAAIMCIFLGWRLYFENVRALSRLEAGAGNYKLTLQSSAPGVFFVLFGVALLMYVLQSKLEIEEVVASPAQQPTAGTIAEVRMPARLQFVGTRPPDPVAQTSKPESSERPNTEVPCIYKSRKLKWFDDDDKRSEREQIIDTLSATRALVLTQLLRAESNTDTFRRHALVLEQIEQGFKQ